MSDNYFRDNINGAGYNNDYIGKGLEAANNNIKITGDRFLQLSREFHSFARLEALRERLNLAKAELSLIKNERAERFGHYQNIRRTAVGMVQATDLGIINKRALTTSAEAAMLAAPGYWLAPCLAALASWANDNPELADIAVKEALCRDEQKASLFFMLICRRARHDEASDKWAQKYLSAQNPEKLGRHITVLLNAYTNGVLTAETNELIKQKTTEWYNLLSEKDGFENEQNALWADVLRTKTTPCSDNNYPTLRIYSKTWPLLKSAIADAGVYDNILSSFESVFSEKDSSKTFENKIDDILNNLVNDYDDEELDLKRREKFEQFVIDFNGDENAARKRMAIESSAFVKQRSFTQVLIDSAMKPASSGADVLTQQLAISLSKNQIIKACYDIKAQNDMNFPEKIDITIGNFNASTSNGMNTAEIIERFDSQLQPDSLRSRYENKKRGGEQTINALMNEVVDLKADFKEKNGRNQRINSFLEQI